MKNNISNTNNSTKWCFIKQIHWYNTIVNTQQFQRTRRVTKEKISVCCYKPHKQCSHAHKLNTVWVESQLLKFSNGENPTTLNMEKDFQHWIKAYHQLTDTVSHCIHQHQNVAHEITLKCSIKQLCGITKSNISK